MNQRGLVLAAMLASILATEATLAQDGCGQDVLIAFNCKGRNICPSCATFHIGVNIVFGVRSE
jgi:hypothetical protein